MAEGNGGHAPRELPAWLYRAGLVALIGTLLYQAVEIRTDVRAIGKATDQHGWRLDLHDKALETQERRIWSVERGFSGAPGGGPR